jgi:two-component system, OmpR family, response regulator VanR
MRVLIAEDERRLAATLARGLRREGMAVDVATDGSEALYKARVTDYDVVVLDRDLPELHGDDVARALVEEKPRTKILMVTAAGRVDQVVDGLGLGADDYVAKPFRFAELVARIRALTRRREELRRAVLRRGDIELDVARREARRAGAPVDLSPKELGVLEVLLEADGAAVDVGALLDRVWDENIDPWTNTLRMTVMGLRRKLGEPAAIETVRGAGYRLA